MCHGCRTRAHSGTGRDANPLSCAAMDARTQSPRATKRKTRATSAARNPRTPADTAPEGADLLHTSVYSELRKRFVMGRIKPGSFLSTRGLAAELGVSQMPVREAVRRLAAEGAVEIRSKKKIVVPAMTAVRFDDLL